VIGNFWSLMKKTKQLNWFTVLYSQVAILFPFIVAGPRFFAGKVPLGEIFQIASAFGQVHTALSWFIDAYSLFASWKATIERLTGFADALEQIRVLRREGERAQAQTEALNVKDLELSVPNGTTLLAPTSFELKKGEPVLVSGPSGAGKSTLFRALAGIWPYWKGKISLPAGGSNGGATLLFLPQKPYLPIGTQPQARQADRPCQPPSPPRTANSRRPSTRASRLRHQVKTSSSTECRTE